MPSYDPNFQPQSYAASLGGGYMDNAMAGAPAQVYAQQPALIGGNPSQAGPQFAGAAEAPQEPPPAPKKKRGWFGALVKTVVDCANPINLAKGAWNFAKSTVT